MILYIIRHAWAHEHDSQRWPNDADRPLTDDGCQRFEKVAKALVKRGVSPSRIATSPLVRCRQTAEILQKHLSKRVVLDQLDALAPGSDLRRALDWTQAQPDDDVAWVGHMPDVAELTAALIGRGEASIHFAKGATAAICMKRLVPGQGQLQWLATAKVLDC